MNKEKHPESYPTCFTDVSSGKKFLTRSTRRSKQTEVIDGVEYGVVVCEITSDTHPAWTGERGFVDTAGRVEKFQKRHRKRS
tara:strand:+ start:17245 stop:17490 length:246 start_codon:yes stop_codon:yes gene_type:complete